MVQIHFFVNDRTTISYQDKGDAGQIPRHHRHGPSPKWEDYPHQVFVPRYPLFFNGDPRPSGTGDEQSP